MKRLYKLYYYYGEEFFGQIQHEIEHSASQHSHVYICPECGYAWATVKAYKYGSGKPERFTPWSHYCYWHGGGSMLALEGTPWHRFREQVPMTPYNLDFLQAAVFYELQLPLRSYCLQYNKAPGAFNDNDQQPEMSYVQKST